MVPGEGDTGEPAPWVWVLESWPRHLSARRWCGCSGDATFPPWPPVVVRIAGPEVMKSLPLTGERAGFVPQHDRASHGGGDASEPAQRHEHKKAGPVPHLLKHLGECPQSLHLYWTAQWSWLWRCG